MVKSMTGYGRAEKITSRFRITAELKSVNHRYLDLSIKMPRRLCFLEGEIRNYLKTFIKRGKVDVYITYEDTYALNTSLKYHADLAAQYLTYLRRMSSDFGLEDDIRTSTLARFPDVFTMDEESYEEEEVWSALQPVLRDAAQKFVDSRIREGEHLKSDLQSKLALLSERVLAVEERSPQVALEYRERLEAKVRELLADTQIEESRIAAEVVIFSDKICNDEETVRLASHINNMRQMLEDGSSHEEGIGRNLDFIAQEMNREANTILSKSNDMLVSNLAIEIKTEIEKIREQVQNIE